MERKHAFIRRCETSKNQFQDSVDFIHDQLKGFNPKMSRLRDLDLFVLDNSIRETTVGQLRGHTLEDKWAIYEEVGWHQSKFDHQMELNFVVSDRYQTS